MQTRKRLLGIAVVLVVLSLTLGVFGMTRRAFAEGPDAVAVPAEEAPAAEDQPEGSPEELLGQGDARGDAADQEGTEPSETESEPQAEDAVGPMESDPDEALEDATPGLTEESPVALAAAPGEAASPTRGEGVIFVDGSRGNDANPGTSIEPVRTFGKAKELMETSGASSIHVLGALQVSDSTDTWDLGGKTLARGDGYHGELINLSSGATLTLTNIVIDGRSADGQTGVPSKGEGTGGSLVGVYAGSTLTLGEGSVLQNNSVERRATWPPESGGAIYVESSVVNIEGGTIRNNEAVLGGGIAGRKNAVINISSGTIEGNRALAGNSTSLSAGYGGCGGGICASDGTDVNFSGGSIKGNSAYERGGGISMGTYYASFYSGDNSTLVLTMTGGDISDNTAGCSGGGIFVQAGYSASGNHGMPTYAIARISGGSITGNVMTDEGDGNSRFGGGGIYVNGYAGSYTSLHNGELYLYNVEISDNSAAIAGGGYAACPVSSTEIRLADGAAIFGNSTDSGNARELYILASLEYGSGHSGNPVYEVSPSMLGGGAYRWVDDSGEEVPLDELKGVLIGFWEESLSLSTNLGADDPAVQRALSLATVHITGNSSNTRGGGIGSNGSVFIGETTETVEIPVSKVWDDGDDVEGRRPDSVAIELYRDGEYVGYQNMRPDEDGNWSTVFRNLPKDDGEGHEYVYTVEEREVDGYSCVVDGDATEGFTITNALTVSISGVKVWDDEDDKDGVRPSSVTITLIRNDEVFESKTVGAEDDWAFSFDDLPKYDADGQEYVYAITEEPVAGYTTQVSGSAQEGFVVTNTHTPEKPVEPPSEPDEKPEKPATPAHPATPLLPKTGDEAIGGNALAMGLLVAGIGAILLALALRPRRGAQQSRGRTSGSGS